ncbi:hypothetical protein VNO77_00475 [Canavalia gladiata]|uniref:NAB domain-containing protein n=1 Tax=Canavalia gladiata TaxID=3824 RepID=A0AAN9MQ28_CANGL
MMINRRSRESIKFFGSLADSENAKELQRTKTDIEKGMTKILKLIKNKERGTDEGNPENSTEEIELVGLIEDLYKKQRLLYALYDRTTEEFVKGLSRRRNRRAPESFSDSDSDSEYFSSEEIDANKRRSEKEHHSVSGSDAPKRGSEISDNAIEVLKTEALELEGKLTSLMKEMESLNENKKNLELEVESQTQQVTELNAKNRVLHEKVLELESVLKEENDVVFDLRAKLKSNEEQTKSNVENLMAKMNELEIEIESLRTQKIEMEEKIECDKNEASTQRQELMDQLNAMQQKLDSIRSKNKELKAEMEIKREEISQCLIQMENLNENLAEMKSVEQKLMEEKESFVERIKDLELELETESNHKNEMEQELSNTGYEIKQLKDENKGLQDRNYELRTAMTERGEEISDFLKEHENNENGASMEAISLKAQVNAMKLELDMLHEQKSMLEQQNERSQKEFAEQAKTVERIAEENKQVNIMCNKMKQNQRLAERKMEELAEEFRKKMEDNIRLLHQRIHVAEQLNNENKNSCNMTKQRYEEENKVLGEKVTSYEEELKVLKEGAKDSATPMVCVPDWSELDLIDEKVEEQREYIKRRVSKMMCEVQTWKQWMKKKNGEVKELKEKVDCLKELLNNKEEEELLLREKVWQLEAKVSKEGGEKMNLTQTVSQLEKKVGKLEKNLKEKDEELVSLGEKKKEAIRQLCFVVDFHRDRCNHLKDLLINRRSLNNRT